jgi:uncharacterized protein
LACTHKRIKASNVRYPTVGTSGGIAGAQVARALLDPRGLHSVRIESTPGILSDHYDPQSKTLRLSPEVYYTPSLAAAGIAAHELAMRCRMTLHDPEDRRAD